jgi:phosphohistidine phosphatase
MRTLYLLRHAKSAWKDPTLDDHDRPLAPRGHRAARAMAQHFRSLGADPELVLCSTAVRTRETLDLVMPGFSKPPIVAMERGLYLATSASILARLREIENRIERVLVIGHNPGLHELALKLAQHGPAKARAALQRKYPTAALATYEVDGDWVGLGTKRTRLADYVTPAKSEAD